MKVWLGCVGLLLGMVLTSGQPGGAASERLPGGCQRWELSVDGTAREALVYLPPKAKESATAVVFVFHGHGGSAQYMLRRVPLNELWPEAISVYMQGLNTPGRLTDPQGRLPGWQKEQGDEQDRDLRFFDAVLARLKRECKVDERRIYAAGHSNGAGFAYLLWAERGDVVAALAPCAGLPLAESLPKLKPKPVLHIAGRKDALVKFAWQQRAIEAVRRLNGCALEGRPWGDGGTIYPSKTGTPLVTFIHPGGHELPAQAPALIVKFFQELSK